MKTLSLAAKPSRLRTKKPTSEGWKQIAVNGLFNYITITSAAAVPGTLCLVLAEKQDSFQISHSPITAWMFQLQDGKEAIVFHGLYNIASISILPTIRQDSTILCVQRDRDTFGFRVPGFWRIQKPTMVGAALPKKRH